MNDEHSLRITLVTNVLLASFMLAMLWALGLIFDSHVAGLLTASMTWSIPIYLSSLDQISLRYRRAFYDSSGFVLIMIVLNIAPLLVEAKSHLFVPIALAALIFPLIAINALMERIVFTDAERLEIRARKSERTRFA